MTDQFDTDDPSRPPIRLAPEVKRQIDVARLADSGLDVNTDALGLVNDRIAAFARSVSEAEALAFAAGYELGPLEFETEFGPNDYRITATRTLQPRQE